MPPAPARDTGRARLRRRWSTSAPRLRSSRNQATLFRHGVSGGPASCSSESGPSHPAPRFAARLRARAGVAVALLDDPHRIEAQLAPLERELRRLARRQAGCSRASRPAWGSAGSTAPTILCELVGDAAGLSASAKAVRASPALTSASAAPIAARGSQTDPPGSPQARLRAPLSLVGPVGVSAPDPDHASPGLRPAALAHPGDADHRPQACPPLLSHPQRARARGTRTRELTPPCPRPIDFAKPTESRWRTHTSGRLPQLPRCPPTGGGQSEDRAAGVVPCGSTHRPSRRRQSCRAPR